MTLSHKPITLENIPSFTLRPADEEECLAAGMSGQIAVRRSVAGADAAFATYWNEDLLCLWGVRNESFGDVSMWLLSCPAANEHKILFGRHSKKLLADIMQRASCVGILVHNDHKLALKWLRWLGFKRSESMTPHFSKMWKDH